MTNFKGLFERDFQLLFHNVLRQSKSVLDIGCGIGDYLCQTNSSQKVVGIEPHLPYVEKALERAPWAEVYNSDGLTFLSETDEMFD